MEGKCASRFHAKSTGSERRRRAACRRRQTPSPLLPLPQAGGGGLALSSLSEGGGLGKRVSSAGMPRGLVRSLWPPVAGRGVGRGSWMTANADGDARHRGAGDVSPPEIRPLRIGHTRPLCPSGRREGESSPPPSPREEGRGGGWLCLQVPREGPPAAVRRRAPRGAASAAWPAAWPDGSSTVRRRPPSAAVPASSSDACRGGPLWTPRREGAVDTGLQGLKKEGPDPRSFPGAGAPKNNPKP